MRSINGMKILQNNNESGIAVAGATKSSYNRQFLKLEPPIIIAKFGMSVTIYFMNKGKKQSEYFNQ